MICVLVGKVDVHIGIHLLPRDKIEKGVASYG